MCAQVGVHAHMYLFNFGVNKSRRWKFDTRDLTHSRSCYFNTEVDPSKLGALSATEVRTEASTHFRSTGLHYVCTV